MALDNVDRAKIDNMGHIEMARILRFGSIFDFPWTNKEAADYFMGRWNMFEGNPEGSTDESETHD